MSRAWMPMYWGDYLRDTGHLTTVQHGAYLLLIAHCWQHCKLPATAEGRAALARMSLREWKAIAPVIEPLFREDGTHKRVEEEVQRTERKVMQARLAGQRGGQASVLSKVKRTLERNPSVRLSEMIPGDTFSLKRPSTNHSSKITSSEYEAARPPPVDKPQEDFRVEPVKATRGDLEAMFAARKAKA